MCDMTKVEQLFPKNHQYNLSKFISGELRAVTFNQSISITELIHTTFVRRFAYFYSLIATFFLVDKDNQYFL